MSKDIKGRRGSFLDVDELDESEIVLPEWDEKELNFELAA